MDTKPLAFIKFYEEKEYAERFMMLGEMYCNTLQYFIDLEEKENDCERGDQYEGASHIFQKSDIKINLTLNILNTGEKFSISEKNLEAPVVIQQSNDINVFCMYSLNTFVFNNANYLETRDLKLNKLGSYAVVVHDMLGFIELVKKYAKDQCSLFADHVLYYEDKKSQVFYGKERIFRKRKIYSHQKEYRLAFDFEKFTGPKILQVGPLTDVACLIELN